ncbi:MAG: bis(5'-nucleosyl)-tetraphosphatase [Thaumarchaeota archaeon]|nr:bis(5'-nucleosyl)-tetraphosphatase [Nitrososphaerota archaeon]
MEERSAGAVLFRRENGAEMFLLLHYPAGHWDYPKGNIEKGEQELETVRREIKEETGIEDIVIIDGFKKVVEYNYKRDSVLVHKKVSYYVAECNTSKVTMSFEHLGYQWLGYEAAMKRLTFKNAKIVLQAAHEFLKKPGAKSLDKFV